MKDDFNYNVRLSMKNLCGPSFCSVGTEFIIRIDNIINPARIKGRNIVYFKVEIDYEDDKKYVNTIQDIEGLPAL